LAARTSVSLRIPICIDAQETQKVIAGKRVFDSDDKVSAVFHPGE
jgi:hypothetical protein